MSTRWLKLMVAAALLCAAGTVRAADLTVRLDAREVQRKRIHTDLTLAVQPGPLTLVYPKWIPGEHGPTGPLDSVVGMVISAGGKPLEWHRDPFDMYAVTVTVPAGTTQLAIAIDSGLQLEGGVFGGGPTSSEQLAVIAWNQFVMLPAGRDAGQISTEASVLAPPGWQLSCALDSHPQADGSVAFEPADLGRLIDSPVQMGAYLKRVQLTGSAPYPQLGHTISIAADSAAALATPADFAAGYSRLVAQAGALFGTRMYRHYTWLLSLSDHVAHFGLEHHESSDDRVAESTLADEQQRAGLAELLAHEYVHSWNGKYRRPAGLLSPDYQKPMDGSLLWVYEGLTQFWGEVLPVRSGLIKPADYREMLAKVVAYSEIESGDRWRPLADTAVAAQDLYAAPGAWTSSRRGVDFYDDSQLLWLEVDTRLLRDSSARVSLDDFMRRFYAGPGGAPATRPYVESDLYAVLSALQPGDWRGLIHRHLDSVGPAALQAGLESSGWRLEYSAGKNTYIDDVDKSRRSLDRLWSIGLAVNGSGGITDTIEDRAAARAGAGPGMKVVAVNGRQYTPEVLDAAIAQAHETHTPIALLIRNADFYRTLNVAYFDGPRFPHLVRIAGRPDLLSEVLKARRD